MSEVPTELLSGLLIEAQDHIKAIRANLNRINGQPDPQAIKAIQDEVNILCGAAEMLELGAMVEVLSPFSEALENVTRDDGWNFTDETQQAILAYLENLETCLSEIGSQNPPEPEERPSRPAPAGARPPILA